MDTQTTFDRALRATLRLHDVREKLSVWGRRELDMLTLEALGYGRGYLDAHNGDQPANSDLALWFAQDYACDAMESGGNRDAIHDAWQKFLRRVGYQPARVVRVEVTVRHA